MQCTSVRNIRFSMNLFIFEISTDMLTVQMDVCMSLCMQNAMKYSFPNFSLMGSFPLISTLFTSDVEQKYQAWTQ